MHLREGRHRVSARRPTLTLNRHLHAREGLGPHSWLSAPLPLSVCPDFPTSPSGVLSSLGPVLMGLCHPLSRSHLHPLLISVPLPRRVSFQGEGQF